MEGREERGRKEGREEVGGKEEKEWQEEIKNSPTLSLPLGVVPELPMADTALSHQVCGEEDALCR
jgi:hypothetical protein